MGWSARNFRKAEINSAIRGLPKSSLKGNFQSPCRSTVIVLKTDKSCRTAMGKAPGTDILPDIPGLHSVPNALSLVTLSFFFHTPPPAPWKMAVALYVLIFKDHLCLNTNKRIICTFPGMPKQEGFFPSRFGQKAYVHCYSLQDPQQFQHLSVRLIRRETERKLVLEQKFKPESESSISSFPFLMQRWDKAGSEALLMFQHCVWCSLGAKAHSSAHRGHMLKFSLHGKPAGREVVAAKVLAEPPWSEWSSSTSDPTAPWSVPSTGQRVQHVAIEESKEYAIVK